MRKSLVTLLVLALVAPSLSSADGWTRTRKRVRSRPARVVATSPVRAAPRRVLASSAATAVRPTPQPDPRHGVHVRELQPVPFWLGGGWGWGYYPLWPRPYGLPADGRPLAEEPGRVSARLEAYGAVESGAAAGTLALSMEGPFAGFGADVTGLALSGAAGDPAATALTLASARASWALVSEAAFRLRFEAGGAMVAVPSTGQFEGTSFAGTTSLGPQVGFSGHVGLVGPFGLEGHARVTPFPVPVLDAKAAFVVRGGSVAVSAGWRSVDVNGDGIDTPEAHFEGPELGLQVRF